MLRFDRPTATMRERAFSVLVASLLQVLTVSVVGIGNVLVAPIIERAAFAHPDGQQVVHLVAVAARSGPAEVQRRDELQPTKVALKRSAHPESGSLAEPAKRGSPATEGANGTPPAHAPFARPEWRLFTADTARRTAAGIDLGRRLQVAVDASVDSARRDSAYMARALTWTVNAGQAGAFGVSPGRVHLGRLVLPLPISLVSIRSADPAYRAQSVIENEMRLAFKYAVRDSIIADAVAGARKRASERSAAAGRYRP